MNTREIIINSAFELFSQKKFADISVQNIIDHAKCSRFSFYKYFHDKYELMHLYYQSYVNDLLLNQYDGSNFNMIQTKIFQFIKDNETYFYNVKDYDGQDSFWSFLTEYSRNFFTAVKCENSGKPDLSEKEKIELIFVLDGAVSVFREYVNNRKLSLPPVQISELLCQYYPNEYYLLSAEKLDGFRRRLSGK